MWKGSAKPQELGTYDHHGYHWTMSWDDPPSMVTPRYDGGELLVKVPGLCRGANAKWPLAYLLAVAVQHGWKNKKTQSS